MQAAAGGPTILTPSKKNKRKQQKRNTDFPRVRFAYALRQFLIHHVICVLCCVLIFFIALNLHIFYAVISEKQLCGNKRKHAFRIFAILHYDAPTELSRVKRNAPSSA